MTRQPLGSGHGQAALRLVEPDQPVPKPDPAAAWVNPGSRGLRDLSRGQEPLGVDSPGELLRALTPVGAPVPRRVGGAAAIQLPPSYVTHLTSTTERAADSSRTSGQLRLRGHAAPRR
jgi:hypothetical protein